MKYKANREALKAALIYVIAGGCWILFSDAALRWLVRDPDRARNISILKGWVFVLVTGGLLYWALLRLLQRWTREVETREQVQSAGRLAAEKLRQSEEQLKLVVKAANDGLWDWNILTGDLYFSPRWREILGYGESELALRNSTFLELLHPDDMSRVEEATRRHLENGDRYALELRLRHKDGGYRWVFSRGECVRNGAGKPVRMVGAVTDITGRKAAEDRRRRDERRYQLICETSPDGVMVIDAQARLSQVNEAFARLTGYARDELTGMRIWDLDADDTPEEVARQLAVVRSQGTVIFERRLRRKDGRTRHMEVSATHWPDYDDSFFCFARDITDRKREALLQQARLRLLDSELHKNLDQLIQTTVDIAEELTGSHIGFFHLVDADQEQLTRQTWSTHTVESAGTVEGRGRLYPVSEAGVVADCLRLGQPVIRNDQSALPPEAGPAPGQDPLVRRLVVPILRHSRVTAVIGVGNNDADYNDDDAQTLRALGDIAIEVVERKQAEESLRQSEALYRDLFELESDALVLLDLASFQLLDCNQAAQKLYGYTREEFLRLHVQDLSAEPEKTRQYVGSGQYHVPLRWHKKKDGTRFPVEISAALIRQPGRVVELGVLRDITARHKMEEELRSAMEELQTTTRQLQEAQRIAQMGSYVFNVATAQWRSSPALDKVFGIGGRSSQGTIESWLGIVHPDDQAQMKKYLVEEVLGKGRNFDVEYRIIRLDDHQVRWVHGLGELRRDDQGRVTEMLGTIQDITERKKAELAVKQSEEKFFKVFRSAPVVIIVSRLEDGMVLDVNDDFERVLGYARGEIIGRTGLEAGLWVDPADREKLKRTVLEAGQIRDFELKLRTRGGGIRYFRYAGDSLVMDGVTCLLSAFVDVTESKLAEEERHKLDQRLMQAQKMEAIGTLAGGIAHDFNNILAAMFGYAYLLKQDTEDNPVAQDSVGEILKSAARAKDLVEQILTFSRRREQKSQVIKLDTVVKEAIRFLRASMPANIEIVMDLAADAPAVLAEPTQIYQVTLNLATNALHAMEGRAGRLTVCLEPMQPDAQLIRRHPELKAVPYARLTVADTGQGMDALTMGRVFEPFFTTKPVGKGTGLGLSVVHGIVEAHQGVITVESEVDHGTKFCLYFPGQKADVGPARPVAKPVPGGQGQRILLVDDEPALTTVIKRNLERLNYQVTACNRPSEAIDWFRENPGRFDLVITDLTMPVISGLEMARELRQLRPDLPILLTSGHPAAVTPEELKETGVCELLQKPASLASLAEAVQRAFTGS
jgi:PAS domain S-box-containing protein